jgi:hypothetical protein
MLILLQAECGMFSRMNDETALTAPVSLHLAVAVARSVPTGYQIAKFNVFFRHHIDIDSSKFYYWEKSENS